MTYSETYAWISRAADIDREIAVLTRKHYEAYSRATAITAQTDGVVTSATKDPHRKMEELAVLGEEIAGRLTALNKTKAEIIGAIGMLEDPQQRTILMERFIPDSCGRVKSQKKLAEELSYDVRHLRRLQRRAIEELKDVLECPLP